MLVRRRPIASTHLRRHWSQASDHQVIYRAGRSRRAIVAAVRRAPFEQGVVGEALNWLVMRLATQAPLLGNRQPTCSRWTSSSFARTAIRCHLGLLGEAGTSALSARSITPARASVGQPHPPTPPDRSGAPAQYLASRRRPPMRRALRSVDVAGAAAAARRCLAGAFIGGKSAVRASPSRPSLKDYRQRADSEVGLVEVG